ncbi:MAG: BamA/TamA family outer membrane protein [Fibrobacterota bacterium]
MTKTIPVLVTLLLTCSLCRAQKVRNLLVSGDDVNTQVIRRITGIRPGREYHDSLAARLAKVPQIQAYQIERIPINDSLVDIRIILDLIPTYQISDFGGAFVRIKQRDTLKIPIPVGVLGAENTNLFNRLHRAEIRTKLFFSRFLELNWQINDYPHDRYALISSRAGFNYAQQQFWDSRRYIRTRAGLYRQFNEETLLRTALIHEYNYYEPKTPLETNEFSEIIAELSVTDSRGEGGINPVRAVKSRAALKSNFILPYREGSSRAGSAQYTYLESSLGVALFIPLPTANRDRLINYTAWDLTIRGRQNPYNKYYLGSHTTLRGFEGGFLGTDIKAENRLIHGMEYRWALIDDITLHFPRLAQLRRELKSLKLEIDGALFYNGGALFENIKTPQKPGTYRYGAGAGAGVRIIFANLNLSASADIAAPLTHNSHKSAALPTIHVFLGMPFN